MMIKVMKGTDPSKLVRYVLDRKKQKQPDIEYRESISTTNLIGASPEQLTRELHQVASLNRKVKRTTVHYSISLPPGEVVTPSQITDISKGLLVCMGHQQCPYFAVQHHDQEDRNDVHHWHVVTVAVDNNGQWVDDSYNYYRLQRAVQALERYFNLVKAPRKPRRERKNLTTGEYRLKRQTGKAPPKEKLWNAIDQAAEHAASLPALLLRLKALRPDISITLHPPTGSIKGISYAIDGIAFAGYKLGAAYSFGGLQKHLGLSYDPARHEDILRQLDSIGSAECHELLTAMEAQTTLEPLLRTDLEPGE
ncbi:MAG: relaxase/mobilization nuclease domain-containing protein [Cyanobacteria bacterium P01_G01_bin.38]